MNSDAAEQLTKPVVGLLPGESIAPEALAAAIKRGSTRIGGRLFSVTCLPDRTVLMPPPARELPLILEHWTAELAAAVEAKFGLPVAKRARDDTDGIDVSARHVDQIMREFAADPVQLVRLVGTGYRITRADAQDIMSTLESYASWMTATLNVARWGSFNSPDRALRAILATEGTTNDPSYSAAEEESESEEEENEIEEDEEDEDDDDEIEVVSQPKRVRGDGRVGGEV